MLSAFSDYLDKLTTRYTLWVIANRYLVAILVISLSVFLCLQAKNLHVESSYKYFYAGDNPQLLAFNDIESTFSKSDNTIIALQPKDGSSIASAKILKIVHELTERLWEMPHTIRVDSIANYQHTRADGDDIIIGDLITAPEQLNDTQAKAIIDLATSKPELNNRLINSKTNTLGLIARSNIQLGDNNALTEAALYAYALCDEYRKRYPDLNILITGFVPRGYLFFKLPTQDMNTLVPVMLGLLVLVMWLLTRSIASPLITISLVALASGSAMGIGSLLGIPVTTVSASAPVIILAVAVADSIHILMTYLILIGKNTNREDAIIKSMEVNARPVFLTTLTTAIGFLSLNFSSSPPYQDLGNFAAFGTITAWVLSMTFLPSMLAIVRIKPTTWISKQVQGINFASDFFLRYKTPSFVLVLLVSIAALVAIPKLEFNEQYDKYFDEKTGENQALSFVTENLVGVFQINYKMSAAGENGAYDPEYLNHLESFTAWLNKQPEVSQVYSINNTFKNLNQSMHNDNDAFYRIPESNELAAQYMLLYELSLPYGLDVTDQIDANKSATRLDVNTFYLASKDFIAFSKRSDNWVKENLPSYMHAYGTSITLMFAQIGLDSYESMKFATIVAFILISICIGLSLSSVRLGALSLILNIIPFLIVFGFCAFNNFYLAVWAVFMVPTSLGLIVDATVHFLSKYSYARNGLNLQPEDSIRYSFTHVGMALWASTLVLVLGFLTLYSASVQTLKLLGLGTAITISLALIINFMVLPFLLSLSEKVTKTSLNHR